MEKNLAIPRAKIYLGIPDLLKAFSKTLFLPLRNGEKVREFEARLSRYFGTKCVIVSRARVALYYVLKNLNLPKGSEVVMTPLTILDMVNAVLCAGFKPVFCDLGERTYNIDYVELERKITPHTKVLLVTHLNGLATDMDRITQIAQKHKLILIEDASQAFGAKFKGKYLGTFGIGIFSLSLFKTCSTIFGGIILGGEITDRIRDDTRGLPPPSRMVLLLEIAKNIIIGMAMSKLMFPLAFFVMNMRRTATDRFVMSNVKSRPGYLDFSMFCQFTDIQAEIGIRKLCEVDDENEKRIKNFQILFENLSPKARGRLPKTVENAINVYWRVPLEINKPAEFMAYMSKRGIDTGQTYLVLNYNSPNALKAKNAVFIPMDSRLKEKDMKYVAEAINTYA